MVEEEKFFAWLDGELPADEAAQIEARVAADPELRRLAEEHRAMVAGLRGAFDSVAAQRLPEPLRRTTGSSHGPAAASLAAARDGRDGRLGPSLWTQLTALAATLVAGIVAGNLLTRTVLPNGPSSPIEAEHGRLVASAELAAALDDQLASAPIKGRPGIGLTFRDKAGAICRTFEDRSATGLACRDRGDWRIRILFQGREDHATDYRMASGSDPQLMAAVEAAIDGEPFDAAAEKAAREQGWQ